MKNKTLLIALLLLGLPVAFFAQTTEIRFNNPAIQYEGRILYKDSAAELAWPGNSVTLQFEGKTISASLKSSDPTVYYNVIVDDVPVRKINTSTDLKSYMLASGLSAGKHKVQLFKLTERGFGKTLFYGFAVPSDTKILPPQPLKKRKIEFFGNSISCGLAMEDTSKYESGGAPVENNYLSYTAITARHFDAQYSCISKSGIGIMVSWFPIIMPEMYNRTDPEDSTSAWNFANYVPDLVIINLFQNDSWIVHKPEHPQFVKRFGMEAPSDAFIIESYRNFVSTIRSKYPQAQIICMLGTMDITRKDSPWPEYVKTAVSLLNDPKIVTFFVPYKETPGHPKVSEHQKLAESLIQFIDQHITW